MFEKLFFLMNSMYRLQIDGCVGCIGFCVACRYFDLGSLNETLHPSNHPLSRGYVSLQEATTFWDTLQIHVPCCSPSKPFFRAAAKHVFERLHAATGLPKSALFWAPLALLKGIVGFQKKKRYKPGTPSVLFFLGNWKPLKPATRLP